MWHDSALAVRRRDFLRVSAAGAAGAAAAGAWRWRRAHGATFGEFPAEAAAIAIPAELRADSVLEVFLYGGLSLWETLYLVEELRARRPIRTTRTSSSTPSLGGGGDSVEAALDDCAFPDGEPIGQFFAKDALGADVELGPFAYRLCQRERRHRSACASSSRATASSRTRPRCRRR